MEKQKTRSEIEDKYKWDLTRIYKTNEDWYKDYNLLNEKVEQIKNYEKNLFDTAENLTNFLKLKEEIDKLQNKLQSYSSLHQSEDSTNVEYQKMGSLISDIGIKQNEYESFYSELFYNTDFKKIEEYAKSSDFLNSYLEVFKRDLRYKEHYLSKEKEEFVLAYKLIS